MTFGNNLQVTVEASLPQQMLCRDIKRIHFPLIIYMGLRINLISSNTKQNQRLRLMLYLIRGLKDIYNNQSEGLQLSWEGKSNRHYMAVMWKESKNQERTKKIKCVVGMLCFLLCCYLGDRPQEPTCAHLHTCSVTYSKRGSIKSKNRGQLVVWHFQLSSGISVEMPHYLASHICQGQGVSKQRTVKELSLHYITPYDCIALHLPFLSSLCS